MGVVLFLGVLLEAKETKLERGEKRFRQLKSYMLKDFHFNWKIHYLDIVTFQTNAPEGKVITLPEKVRFFTSLKIGATDRFTQRKQRWLAKAILKSDYFWKRPMHPYSAYAVTSMRFLERGDRRFKAITELQDIKDMFGTIDTEAELRIWIMASDRDARGIYSYRKTARGYRVRFRSQDLMCNYREYLRDYDREGKMLRSKVLKSYRVKNCSEIML